MLNRDYKSGKASDGKKQKGATRSAVHTGKTVVLPWTRMLQVVISLLLLTAVFISAPQLMNWLNQPIARVEVHAPFLHLQQGRVEKQLDEYLQERFFQLNLVAIQQELLQIPWVKNATVKRAWPDRLLVTIDEQQAVARWRQESLIGSDGMIFTPDRIVDFSELPVLAGPEYQALEVMQQYLAISQLLRPMGLTINELRLGDTGAWRFKVDGKEISLGRDRRMERLQRFIRLYHARLEQQWIRVERVDLRYLNGASVAWSDEMQKR